MKAKVLLLTAVLLAMFAPSTFPQVSVTGHVSVTIVSPISVEKVQDLSFGDMAINSGDGTITVSPHNKKRSASGSVELMDGGNVSVASLRVKANQGVTFSISLPNSPLSINNGGKNMTVTDFTSSPNESENLADGSKNVYIGATLIYGGSKDMGNTASTTPIPVIVNYN